MNKKLTTRLSLVLLAIMLLFAIGLSVTAMPTETAARAESKYGPVTVYNTAFEWNIYDYDMAVRAMHGAGTEIVNSSDSFFADMRLASKDAGYGGTLTATLYGFNENTAEYDLELAVATDAAESNGSTDMLPAGSYKMALEWDADGSYEAGEAAFILTINKKTIAKDYTAAEFTMSWSEWAEGALDSPEIEPGIDATFSWYYELAGEKSAIPLGMDLKSGDYSIWGELSGSDAASCSLSIRVTEDYMSFAPITRSAKRTLKINRVSLGSKDIASSKFSGLIYSEESSFAFMTEATSWLNENKPVGADVYANWFYLDGTSKVSVSPATTDAGAYEVYFELAGEHADNFDYELTHDGGYFPVAVTINRCEIADAEVVCGDASFEMYWAGENEVNNDLFYHPDGVSVRARSASKPALEMTITGWKKNLTDSGEEAAATIGDQCGDWYLTGITVSNANYIVPATLRCKVTVNPRSLTVTGSATASYTGSPVTPAFTWETTDGYQNPGETEFSFDTWDIFTDQGVSGTNLGTLVGNGTEEGNVGQYRYGVRLTDETNYRINETALSYTWNYAVTAAEARISFEEIAPWHYKETLSDVEEKLGVTVTTDSSNPEDGISSWVWWWSDEEDAGWRACDDAYPTQEEIPDVGEKLYFKIQTAASASGNFASTEKVYAFTILKAPLTVRATDKEITYGEEAPAQAFYAFEGEGFAEGEDASDLDVTNLRFDCSYEQWNDASAYPISLGGITSNHYDIAYQNGTLTVNKATVQTVWTIPDGGYLYDGTVQSAPIASATGLQGETLSVFVTETQNREFKYCGDYTFAASIADDGDEYGNYALTDRERAVTMGQRLLTYTWDAEKTYNGEAQVPTVISVEGLIEGDEGYVAPIFSGNRVNAGSWIGIEGATFFLGAGEAGDRSSNYTCGDAANYRMDFVIRAKKVAVAINEPNLAYDGTRKVLSGSYPTVVYDDEAEDYVREEANFALCSGDDDVTAGSTFRYLITIADPNYELTGGVGYAWDNELHAYAATRTVAAKTAVLVLILPDSFVYSGEEKILAAEYWNETKDQKIGDAAVTVYGDNINRGTFTVTFSIDDSYTLMTYDDCGYEKSGESVGTASYTILPKEVAVTLAVPDLTYDNAIKMVTGTYEDVNGEECLALVNLDMGDDNVNAGNFGVTITIADENYKLIPGAGYTMAEGVGTASYTILPKPITVDYNGGEHKRAIFGDADSWAALDDPYSYLSAELAPSDAITDVVSLVFKSNGGEELSIDELGSATDAETYAMVASDLENPNYLVTLAVNENKEAFLLVDKADLTVSFGEIMGATYGTAFESPALNGSRNGFTVTGWNDAHGDGDALVLDNFAIAYAPVIGAVKTLEELMQDQEAELFFSAPIDAGTYYMILGVGVRGFANYNEAYALTTFTIAKKALTITAEDAVVTYGNAAPAFTVAYGGFAYTEDETALRGFLAFDCAYIAGDGAGETHAITPHGLTSDNYEITFVPGVLTVNKRPIVVSYRGDAPLSYEYGDASVYQLNLYNYLAVGGDGIAEVNGDSVYSVVPVTLSVGTKNSPISAELGDDNFGFAATYWLYILTPSVNANYALTDALGDDAKLEITKKALTITADNKRVAYGDETPAFTVSYSGFAYDDAEKAARAMNSVFDGELACACSRTLTSAVGSYAITPSGVTARNYAVTFAPGVLMVGEAALTVELNVEDTVYGTAVKAPVVNDGITVTGWKNGQTAAQLVTADKVGIAYILKDGDKTFDEMTNAIEDEIGKNRAAFMTAHRAIPTAAGTYYACLTVSGIANYSGAVAYDEFTIARKVITVTAENKVSDYGAPLVDLTVTGAIESGDVVCAAATDADNTKVGVYNITLTSTNNPNYIVTLVGGTYTIRAKADKVETNAAGETVVEKTEKLSEDEAKREEGVGIINMIRNVVEAAAEAPVATLALEIGENATVSFDKAAILSLAEKEDVKITYKETKAGDIDRSRRELRNAELVIDVSLVGASFDGGRATITTAFESKASGGKKAVLYYVDETGKKTDMNATFADGVLSFETEHFSTYIVEYKLTGGAVAGIVIACVVLAAGIAFCLFYLLVLKKRGGKKKSAKAAAEAPSEAPTKESAEENTEESAEENTEE